MAAIYPLHENSSLLGLGSAWWGLTTDKNSGDPVVVHAWCRVNAHFTTLTTGERSYSVEAFRSGNAPQEAKDALQARLVVLGRA